MKMPRWVGFSFGSAFHSGAMDMKNDVLTTGIAEDHVITPGQMNPFANIICSRTRLSADPNLIAREGTPPALKQDWISSSRNWGDLQLEGALPFQVFRRRLGAPGIATQGCNPPGHHFWWHRARKTRCRFFEFGLHRF